MKKIAFILCLLPCYLSAQNKYVDSVEKVLAITKADTEKVNLLNNLASLYTETFLDKGLGYVNRAVKLSREIKFLKGEANAVLIRGNIKFNLLRPDSAMADYKTAMAIYKKLNKFEKLAYVYIDMGTVLRFQGRNTEAAQSYQQAADLFEKINSPGGTADCLIQMANIYNIMNLYDKALAPYKKAYEIRVKIHQTDKAAQALGGLGITYRNKQMYAKDDVNFSLAIKYMMEGRATFIKIKNKLNRAFMDREIGITYLNHKDYKNALVYLLGAETTLEEMGHKREMAELFIQVGRTYFYLENYPKTKFYLEKGLAMAITQGDQQNIVESYGFLRDYYGAIGDVKTELRYFEKYTEEKDTLNNRLNFNKFADVTAKYETEKKEQQIKLLNKENTIQKLSITSRNKTIGIIAGLFLLSGIVAALFFYRHKLKERAHQLKQQDLLTKAIVDAEENERKRIASDLHDGVGQLFSAVKMNLSGLFERLTIAREEDRFLAENTLALVDESCKEVRSISHQMMPNMLLRSGIANDLKSFIEKIDSDTLKVTLEAAGFKSKLESNVETMLYRIIQETINNVIKHAHATRLDIILNRDSTGINAQIIDNGIGFDVNKREDFTGIGLKNIATRIEYLKGAIKYISEPGKGTTVVIEVPV